VNVKNVLSGWAGSGDESKQGEKVGVKFSLRVVGLSMQLFPRIERDVGVSMVHLQDREEDSRPR
jgi:hypothetical protein